MTNQELESAKRIGTGLAFVVFPIVFILAFAIHPNLFSLAIVTDVNTRIGEFHREHSEFKQAVGGMRQATRHSVPRNCASEMVPMG